MGELNSELDNSMKYSQPLEYRVANLRRHFSWFVGHFAYTQIRIDQVVKSKPKKDEEKSKEQERDEILQMVVQSNLLAGGIEDRFLFSFSQQSKEKMKFYALVLGDEKLKEAVAA